jgi:AcrR family transcriptional regulator
VAEGTIYRHFSSKQHLLNEVYRGAARWALQVVQDGAARGGAVRERLDAVARALVEGAARDPGVIRMLTLISHGDLLDPRSRDAERGFREALESIIARGKADGAVRPGSVEVWSAVWLAVLGHALARVADKTWRQEDGSVATTIEAAWRAIAA